MSAKTSIEWTDRTWNPTTGCDKVSPGCAHCYAATIANRLWPTTYPKVPDDGFDIPGAVNQLRTREFTDIQTHDRRLGEPQRWKQPQRVFVNSMSDLFHEAVPDAFVAEVWRTMHTIRRHTYQILTKRAPRMAALVPRLVETFGVLPNVWLGTSIENQRFADERIPLLLQTPAAVRFISAEPLLGPVNLMAFCDHGDIWPEGHRPERGLDWVIIGGESGSRARPMDLAWMRDIIQQCHAAGVPVFVKQLGSNCREPSPNGDPGLIHWVTHDRKGGRMDEWPDVLRVREYPARRT